MILHDPRALVEKDARSFDGLDLLAVLLMIMSVMVLVLQRVDVAHT